MDAHDRLTDRWARRRRITLAAALSATLPALVAANVSEAGSEPNDSPVEPSTRAAAASAALDRIEALIGELRELARGVPETSGPTETTQVAPKPKPDSDVVAEDNTDGGLPATDDECGPIRTVQAEGNAWIDSHDERHEDELQSLWRVNDQMPLVAKLLESDDIDAMCEQQPVQVLRSLQNLLVGLPFAADSSSGTEIAVCAERLMRQFETAAATVGDPDLETLYETNRHRLSVIVAALYKREEKLAIAGHKQRRLARELSDLLGIAKLQCEG